MMLKDVMKSEREIKPLNGFAMWIPAVDKDKTEVVYYRDVFGKEIDAKNVNMGDVVFTRENGKFYAANRGEFDKNYERIYDREKISSVNLGVA